MELIRTFRESRVGICRMVIVGGAMSWSVQVIGCGTRRGVGPGEC
jgi:hypothetical protein